MKDVFFSVGPKIKKKGFRKKKYFVTRKILLTSRKYPYDILKKGLSSRKRKKCLAKAQKYSGDVTTFFYVFGLNLKYKQSKQSIRLKIQKLDSVAEILSKSKYIVHCLIGSLWANMKLITIIE